MCRCASIVLAVYTVLLFYGNTRADFVSGEVWGVWDPSGNPYEVIGDLEIPEDSSLVINPGVFIIFNDHYEFRVNSRATLSAVGTEADSIIFTVADTSVGWKGIYFGELTGIGNQISFCRLEYGKAITDDRGYGGAIYIDRLSFPAISHNNFHHNVANYHGGAIYIERENSVTISYNLFSNNHASLAISHGRGGAIYVGYISHATIVYNNFIDNSTSGEGGAIGVSASSESIILSFNLFNGNAARNGGAVKCSYYDDWLIKNNTFYDNHAISKGGAIFIYDGSGKTLMNNILWNNNAYEHPQIYVSHHIDDIEINYNNIEGGNPYPGGIGNIDEEPCFVNPGVDFELRENSPCINTGSPWEPPDPDGTRSDMGAFYCDEYRWVFGELTIDDSPYLLRTDAEVPADSALVIDPGVEILFTGPCYFRIWDNAVIQANGTSEEPVIFDAQNAYEGWGGIDFHNASSNSYLNYCVIVNARFQKPGSPLEAGGIECHNSSPAISNCRIYDNRTFSGYGGAIACYDNSSPVLERNQIYHNHANYGGALYLDNSNMIVNNNTIVHNMADVLGGGAFLIQDASMTLHNTIMYTNYPIEESEIYLWPGSTVNATYCDIRGGWAGEDNIDSNPLLIGGIPYDCNLTELSPCIDTGDPSSPLDPDGTIADMGALPYYHIANNVYGEWTLDNSPYVINRETHIPAGSTLVINPGVEVIFEGHYQFIVDSSSVLQVNGTQEDSVLFTAIDTTEGWSGIRFINSSQESNLEHCIIEYGNAYGDTITDSDGGAVFFFDSSPTLSNCRIHKNKAQRYGGAIASYGESHPIIEKCLISGNEAQQYGGAVYTESSNLALANNTITDNSVGILGGGLTVNNCSTVVSNNIIWSNSGSQIHLIGTATATVTYTDIQDGWDGEGNINADPLFQGGEPYSYKLTTFSPCIDAGDPSSPHDPDDTRADMGAFYYHHTYDFVHGQWTIDNSPYYIDHDIGVPPGTTLVIDPGVEVIFNDHYKFVVDSSAVLQAIGTHEDSISFTAADTAVGWHGIRFVRADSSSHLSYCRIQYGKAIGEGGDGCGGGIHCQYSPITISNCDIYYNYASYQGGGIYLWGSCANIQNNLIHNNSSVSYGGGICCYWSDVKLYNNTVVYNSAGESGGGIKTRYCEPVITNSIIWENTSDQIHYEYGKPLLTYCDILGGYAGEGNIDDDPIFVNPDSIDFNLHWGSPCIDVGDPEWSYDSDNTRADMGALYFFHEGTEVYGEIWGHWESLYHPYYVTDDISVPTDSTLVIDHGVIVYIMGSYSIRMDSAATIQAYGTEDRPITFTCPDTSIGWFGIRFYDVDSTSILDHCIIQYVKTDGHDYYAPLYINRSNPTISNCIIRNNIQYQSPGGGIRCVDNSSPLILNCLITENKVSYAGGGIHCYSHSSPQILNCEITDNYAPGSLSQGGGIFCDSYCLPIIRNCLISDNRTIGGKGSGIFLRNYSSATIEKCVIAHNIGGYGSAIYNRSNSNPLIVNCAIVGNSDYRGAIYCEFGADPVILNSILWDNTPTQIYLRQSGDGEPCTLSVAYTDLQDGIDGIDTVGENYIVWGAGNIDENPFFTDPYMCYLEEDSPCIDTGNPGPNYNDPEDPDNPGYALWPAMGTLRNDMGAYGGYYDEITGIVDHDIRPIPQTYAIFQNYPNPFNAYTTIQYNLPKTSEVRIVIYNILGQQVEILTSGWQNAGYHSIIWKANDKASGMYFYRIKAGQDYTETKKMLLLK